MKRVLLAAAVFAAACNDATTPDLRPKVRFLNATEGMQGSGGFTVNGVFAAGSALATGQAAQKCSGVNAGSTTFGFGVLDPKGAGGLSGNPLATLSNQNITDPGDFIVAATGNATSPTLFMFDNSFSGTLGTDEAAVRFVNLAPGTDAASYVVFKGAIGTGPQLALNLAVGAPTSFTALTSGSNEFSILKLPGHVVALEGSAATLTLQAGSVNTLAIVRNASGGYQLINLPRCS